MLTIEQETSTKIQSNYEGCIPLLAQPARIVHANLGTVPARGTGDAVCLFLQASAIVVGASRAGLWVCSAFRAVVAHGTNVGIGSCVKKDILLKSY